MRDAWAYAVIVATALIGLVWSGVAPAERFTWFLEVLPVVARLPLLIATRRRFPPTPLAYGLITLHACILMIGAHYTYAQAPLFDWFRDEFGLARNHYDRVAHFVQGFVPAVLTREILLRTSPLRPGGWRFW
jgi:putative membrane protein